MVILAILLGIVLLVKGADMLVDGAVKIGEHFRVSQVLVGVFIVSIGTSLPELVVGLIATLQGEPHIAIGNFIGSNITNIGLIVGIAALFGGISISKKIVDYDIPLSILPLGVLVFGYIFDFTLGKYIGVLLLLAYIAYLLFTAREYSTALKNTRRVEKLTVKTVFFLVVGVFLLILGGDITIRAAQTLSSGWGLSDAFTGAVLLSFGTSLPELITTLTAIFKKEGALALGNVLGSNVFNLLVGMAFVIILKPIELTSFIYEIIFLGIVSFVFIVLSKTGKRYSISRWEGGVLLLCYIMYLVIVSVFAR